MGTRQAVLANGTMEQSIRKRRMAKGSRSFLDSWGVTRNYFDPELNRNGEIRKHEGYITELTTDAALDWMREQIEDEPLFFLLPALQCLAYSGLGTRRVLETLLRGIGRALGVRYLRYGEVHR